jgi:pimeloyl-ACP methyl ester carboxylesterase
MSGKPVGRAIDVYKDIDSAVNLVLRETRVTKINLVAHSWGGSVAMLYASKFPGKINKLVLYAPSIASHDTDNLKPVDTIYDEMTPDERVRQMNQLTPQAFRPYLQPEITGAWKEKWLLSDPLAKNNPHAPVKKVRRTRKRLPCHPSREESNKIVPGGAALSLRRSS